MSLFFLLFFVFLFEVHLCLWMSHCSSLICWKNCLSSVVLLCTFFSHWWVMFVWVYWWLPYSVQH